MVMRYASNPSFLFLFDYSSCVKLLVGVNSYTYHFLSHVHVTYLYMKQQRLPVSRCLHVVLVQQGNFNPER